MDNKKGYLNSFKGQLEERFLFLSFKEEREDFKTQFTKEEIGQLAKAVVFDENGKEILEVKR